jgi:hypothetical protein
VTANRLHRRKRRNCYDQFRKRWLERRRARKTNLAASAATQLLGLFTLIAGKMPITAPLARRYIAPAMSPQYAQRVQTAKLLGVPTRYLDIVQRTGKVPYAVLGEHIRLGGATRRDALDELRKTVPAEALDWLAYIEKQARWSELFRCFRPGDSEEDTRVLFLKSTLAWVELQKESDANLSEPTEATHGLKPPKPGENKHSASDAKPPSR